MTTGIRRGQLCALGRRPGCSGRCPVHHRYGAPRPTRATDVSAVDLVPQRVKPSSGIGLGRPVQRMLQGTNRVRGRTSRSGGTSRHRHSPSPSLDEQTHRRSSGPSLTAGYVVRSTQAVLLPPPTPFRLATHFPRSSVIECHAPATPIRRLPGRGGSHQFPSPLSERSAPHTPGSPSTPALPGLQRLPWPSPCFRRFGTPCTPPLWAGPLTTPQGFDPAGSPTKPPVCYRAS